MERVSSRARHVLCASPIHPASPRHAAPYPAQITTSWRCHFPLHLLRCHHPRAGMVRCARFATLLILSSMFSSYPFPFPSTASPRPARVPQGLMKIQRKILLLAFLAPLRSPAFRAEDLKVPREPRAPAQTNPILAREWCGVVSGEALRHHDNEGCRRMSGWTRAICRHPAMPMNQAFAGTSRERVEYQR